METQQVAQLDAGASLLQMFASLGICIALFLVVVYFLKRFKLAHFHPPQGLIAIKDKTSLDHAHQLYVVEVKGATYLVGTSSTGICVDKVQGAAAGEFAQCLNDAQGKVV